MVLRFNGNKCSLKNVENMNNKYFILRHGEALSNKKGIISCLPEKFHNPLSLKGKRQIKTVVPRLKKEKIDLIFSSSVLRARQTAEIIAKELKIKPKYDKRLKEYNFGIFNGRSIEEFRKILSPKKRFENKLSKGETFVEIKKRMSDFLKDIDKKYSNKNILIISHEAPITQLEAKLKGISNQEFFKKYPKKKRINPGELRQLR